MSVLVVGMSYRSAPVALLERLSMDEQVSTSAVQDLVSRESISEAMIISTCNRLEVYTVTNAFHAGVRDIVGVLRELSGVDTDTLRSYLYVRFADAAAEHMLVVTSGLDSMVVGEQQIIGQMRSAYNKASDLGTVGPTLHALAQAALHTGKRVHSETAIDEAGGSMVTFALDKACETGALHSFEGTRALVLGAGAMASLAASHLGKRGVRELIIANRTFERAERVASHSREAGVPATAIEFACRADAIPEVDIVVSATGADTFTVTAADIDARTPEHPLAAIDLSLPRDIEDAVGGLDNVNLVNIESLHKSVTSRDSTSPAHRQAQAIVAEEVTAFSSAQRVRDVAPAVTALRKSANSVAQAELDLLRPKLDGVDPAVVKDIERTVHRIVDKLLHEPTVQAKRLAAESATLTYATALQQLFGLHTPDAPAVAVDVAELPNLDLGDTADAQARAARADRAYKEEGKK